MFRRLTLLVVAFAILSVPVAASAHEERKVHLPDGSGSVPTFRTAEPDLLVCGTDATDFARRISGFSADLKTRNETLFAKCQKDGYRGLQEAVDAVRGSGINIAILPGLYTDESALAKPTGECANLKAPDSKLGYQILSYDQQKQCPHNQNMVAIMGVKDLQIEGTGASPLDVVIDAQYRKLNAIRADLSDGIYFKNFTAQRTTFNSLYVLGVDGFVIDDVLTRWNDEYGFLTFASDHGLYTNCESYGNGDSGIYPGSASDLNPDLKSHELARYSIEISHCKSHHNMVGFSGTAGNSIWVHDTELYDNIGGASMDSLFPGHPGLPQNHTTFERNKIYDNNQDFYRYVRDGTCKKPASERGYEQGVVCPSLGLAPGSGIIIAGGNWNLFRDNWIYGNKAAAFNLIAAPAFLRGENSLSKQFDTSHDNVYVGNKLGVDPAGAKHPNGSSVFWDGQGGGNCWQDDAGVSTPTRLPHCSSAGGASGGPSRLVGDPLKVAKLYVCSEYSAGGTDDNGKINIPSGCDWFGGGGMQRLEAQIAGVSAAIGAIFGLLVWFRRLRSSKVAGVALLAGLVGLGVLVWAATSDYSRIRNVVGFALVGAWFLIFGLMLLGQRWAYALLTILLGVCALAAAFDRSIAMIPWIKLGPTWLLGILGLIWSVWSLFVIFARKGKGEDDGEANPPAGDREPADPRPTEPAESAAV